MHIISIACILFVLIVRAQSVARACEASFFATARVPQILLGRWVFIYK